jgi:signal transduction histidine kinase
MKRLGAHRRIVIGFSVVMVAIAVLGTSGIVRLSHIEGLAGLIATDSMRGLTYTSQIEFYTYQESLLIQRHILATEPAEKRRLESEIAGIDESAARLLELYRNTPFGDAERPIFNQVMATRPGFLRAVDKVLRLSRETTSADAQVELQRGFEPEFRVYLDALRQSTRHNLAEADDAAHAIQASVISARRSSIVEAVGSLLLALISAFLLARGIAETEASSGAIESLNGQLQARIGELTSVNQELEAFTYSVSHDLRAPLRHIDGFSKILMDESGPFLDPAGKRAATRIRYGAQLMGRMIDDLLEFSRMGRRDISRRVTSLRSVVDASIEVLRPVIEGRDIQFRIDDLPTVECDPALLRHVMVNLLSNAIKFTRDGNPAIIEIGQTIAGQTPAIFVRDNGTGFDMRYAGKLFGIFQRLHRREDYEGVGVGLATVQRIIHKHGGRVWAEAELGKGATFYFTLQGAVEPKTMGAQTA